MRTPRWTSSLTRTPRRTAVALLAVAPLLATLVVGAASAADATATPRCHSVILKATEVRREGAAGSIYVSYALTNVSASTCFVKGYVAAQIFRSDGRPVAFHSALNGGPTPTVVVHAHHSAYFFVHMHNPGILGCTPLSTAPFFVITPPGETAPVLVHSSLAPCWNDVATSPLSATLI